MRILAVLASLLLCTIVAASVQAAPARSEQPVELIPREALFQNPDRIAVKISPNGKYLSWMAPLDGVLNVWVAPSKDPSAARAVTHSTGRAPAGYAWSYQPGVILYMQDSGGNENYHVYALDVETANARDLTPYPGSRSTVSGLSHRYPKEALIRMNDRNAAFADVYRVDLTTGERTLVMQNDGYSDFLMDDEFRVRMAFRSKPDGSEDLLEPDGEGGWKSVGTVPVDDGMTTQMLDYTSDGKILYSLDSRGRNTAALFATDTATGERTLLLENAKADVNALIRDPDSGRALAAGVEYLRKEWTALDPVTERDLTTLKTSHEGGFSVESQTRDNRTWIVTYHSAAAPSVYYRYDRKESGGGTLTRLFSSRPALEGKPLVEMHPVELRARDGLSLTAYLTLPPGSDPDGDGRPASPVPLVLLVHGGPWARDSYGYMSTPQWLANRGYAVLNVNYRGSTGFGKEFINVATGQFAGTMHDDLIDAVDWAIQQKITRRDQVAIMGGSYGGYATLVGMTFTPEQFRCGVDIVGPSSLVTLIESFPEYWAPHLEGTWYKRVGDPRTEAGRKALLERSPITRVEAIRHPLLVGQGANDPRVTQAESDNLVATMEEREIPVIYALFADEGHGFARPQNRMAFNAIVEAFFGQCLGGRVEPIGTAFKGSSLAVPHGAQHVPGLETALEMHQPDVRK